jgi:alkylhydroperoxidase family enzyme
MARLPYLDKNALSPANQDLDRPENNLYRVLNHSPNCSRIAQRMADFVFKGSRLDGRLKELAIMAVAYLARSSYAWSHHLVIRKNYGVSDEDVRQLMNALDGQSHTLDERAGLVIAAAREMTEKLTISDRTFAGLRGFLDNESLVDLVVIIGHYNSMGRVLRTLEIDIEADYLPPLDEFPLPA